jgi:glycosyltransferase involved in cell wall biosynthesis
MTVRRIFHVQLGRDGGTERFFVTLAQAFAERGVEQGFAIRPGRGWRHEIERLGEIHEGTYLRRTPGSLLALWRMQRAMRAFAPDVAMAWRAPAARLIPDLRDTVKIVRLGDYPRHVRHFRHLDAVVCNNPSIARHTEGLGWNGAMPIISNFARPVTPVPVTRAEMDTPPGAFVIGSAGSLVHRKAYDTLLRAVAGLPDAWLWLAGDGEDRTALEALAARLGIAGRVRFAGWMAEPMNLIAGRGRLRHALAPGTAGQRPDRSLALRHSKRRDPDRRAQLVRHRWQGRASGPDRRTNRHGRRDRAAAR